MKAQEWLEKNYPDQETGRIDINQQLEGTLDCSEYKRLEHIFISSSVDSSKLEIRGGSYKDLSEKIKETKITLCLPTQTWLDQNYPKNGTCQIEDESDDTNNFGKTRAEVKELNITEKALEGTFDLFNFKNLEELYCWDNYLTNLKVNNCKKLKEISCSNNQLITLKVSSLVELEELDCSNNYLTQIIYPTNPERITELDISNNNLNPSNLSIFSPFRNLERLYIGNWNKNKINQNIYNNFTGSCEPLKDLNKLEVLDISNTDLDSGWEHLPDSLEYLYYDTKIRPNCKLVQVKEQWDQELWKDIHQDFAPKWKKAWLEAGFNKEQTKKFLEEWSQLEVKLGESSFINWFLNFRKLDLTWALENEEEFRELRIKYSSFKTCPECQQPNTSQKWCQPCNAKHFQTEFKNWTSGNSQIDKFIQKCQLEATSPWNVLEWIPYEKFDKKTIELQTKLQTINSELQSLNLEYGNLKGKSKIKQLVNRNKKKETKQKISEHSLQVERITNEIEEGKGEVEPIARGGFGKVEKAKWEEGSIRRWDNKKKGWQRNRDYDSENRTYKNYKTVALKTLFNSQNLNQDFLQELVLYKMFKSEVSNMVPCYGISKDKEGNYIMVMKYMAEGNLREYLRKNKELNFYDVDMYGNIKSSKFHFLQQITQGLKDIHRKKLVHCDFHSGNIVVDYRDYKYNCHITDLGLAKPVNETQTENTIYGLMPYMAPEVLKGEKYTKAADIYSLGMVMYEVITCLPPFYDQDHDVSLALKIIQGIRPSFSNSKTPLQVKYPQILVDLIKKCWDSEPHNRPTAKGISGIVGEWFNEHSYLKENTNFYHQYQEAEAFNKTLPKEIKYPTYHSQEVWHSKPINTKQITELLTTQGITLDLDSLNIQDPQEESSHQAQVEINNYK